MFNEKYFVETENGFLMINDSVWNHIDRDMVVETVVDTYDNNEEIYNHIFTAVDNDVTWSEKYDINKRVWYKFHQMNK